eukprot:815809-Pyramimonas_sp.AAC.1
MTRSNPKLDASSRCKHQTKAGPSKNPRRARGKASTNPSPGVLESHVPPIPDPLASWTNIKST